jgi:hypothetical protein
VFLWQLVQLLLLLSLLLLLLLQSYFHSNLL